MGRSQRHMLWEQGTTAVGEIHAQGVVAPGIAMQVNPEALNVLTPGPPLFNTGLEWSKPHPDTHGTVEVPIGGPGGPLSGSTLTGAIPIELEGGGGGTEPEPSVLMITSPPEGATVPPVHDIMGFGAPYDTEVELVHEDVVVSTTTSDGAGGWGFTGDTPASLGPVTWVVRSGGQEASVNITVEEEELPAARKTRKTT